MVHSRSIRPGKECAVSATTSGTTGRNPVCAHSRCARGVKRKSTNDFAATLSVLVLTTATGFSILKVCGGTTYSTWWARLVVAFARSSMMASFS